RPVLGGAGRPGPRRGAAGAGGDRGRQAAAGRRVQRGPGRGPRAGRRARRPGGPAARRLGHPPAPRGPGGDPAARVREGARPAADRAELRNTVVPKRSLGTRAREQRARLTIYISAALVPTSQPVLHAAWKL